MASDPHTAAEFYGSVQGEVAARMVRRGLARVWPSVARQDVLGIGYPTPYLRTWRDEAARCIALMPAQIGAARWPAGAPNLTCTAEEDALPFADLSFDRVLLVHGLEGADNARRLLREVWRVLRDDGRLLVIAPNRRGWWAHVDSTPFGQGQPYSPGQIGRLLAASMFRVEQRDTALYVPPTPLRFVLRGARVFERAGRALLPQLAGVTLTEATKDVFSALPVTSVAGQRVPGRRLMTVQPG
jgi:SAM-dependent methyltransferase